MAGSCGSGTSSAAQPCAANSRHAAVADRLGELRIGVVGEELPGGARAPLLAHEQHRGEGPGQDEGRGAGQQPGGERGGEPVAQGPVADLVVGLRVADEAVGRGAGDVDGAAVGAAPEGGVGAVVEERAGHGLGDGGQRRRGEIRVIALGLAGEGGVQGVVEVVVPLGVQAEAARRARGRGPRVAEVGLGDQRERTAQFGRERVGRRGQLLQEGQRPPVGQGVHRVQPQPVQPVVPQPGERAAQQERPHLVRAGGVEIDRRAPRRAMGLGEVRAEGREVIAGRAEVVVDHVQQDRETETVRRVHEALQPLRPAVRFVHRPERHALVPPPVGAGERADRHQRHMGDAEPGQVPEPGRRRVEGALLGVRADVQLVQDGARKPPARPVGAPLEQGVVDDGALAVRPVRLAA